MPARIIRALHTFALIRIAYQKHQTGRVNATQVAGKFGMTVGKFVPSVTVPILPLEGNFLAEEILGKDWKGRKRKDVERKGRASSRCIVLPPPPLSLSPHHQLSFPPPLGRGSSDSSVRNRNILRSFPRPLLQRLIETNPYVSDAVVLSTLIPRPSGSLTLLTQILTQTPFYNLIQA